MIDFDELERLLGQATPGPLVVLDATPIGAQVLSIASDARPKLAIVARLANTVSGRQIGDEDRANAALFVALRNAAEELIRDARRWREHEASLMSNSGAEMSINSGGWALLKHAMEVMK